MSQETINDLTVLFKQNNALLSAMVQCVVDISKMKSTKPSILLTKRPKILYVYARGSTPEFILREEQSIREFCELNNMSVTKSFYDMYHRECDQHKTNRDDLYYSDDLNNRQGLQQLFNVIPISNLKNHEQNTTILFSKVSQLSIDLLQLLKLCKQIERKGVKFIFLDLPDIDTSNETGIAMYSTLGILNKADYDMNRLIM